MVFLALHIAGNAAFLLLVRVARGRRFDYPLAGLTNYATAALLAALALVWLGPPAPDPRAAAFGAANGAQYQVTFILMYTLYGLLGVAVTSSLLRLSIVVPVLASIVLWGEWPTPAQGLGLLLAAAALPLLSAPARGRPVTAGGPGAPRRPAVLALGAATLLISGIGLLAAKAFAELDRPEQRPVYVLAVYAVATALAGAAWPWRRRFRERPGTGKPPFGAAGAVPAPEADSGAAPGRSPSAP